MRYDVLVVGGGIAGMESALTLGDMGRRVLLVEKQPSIGGKMILLSKVFPTLDCASCIATPKMAATANHDNITLMVYSEVERISPLADGSFRVQVARKPTYVDAGACTGCAQCEDACTVSVADEYNRDLIARRAAHIAFPQAVPKKAVLDRRATSPCTHTCPAGVKAHGYVSLIRAGKIEEAYRLHLQDAPIPGSLSRACYAPCEGECTRGDLEGPVAIRALKRFMVDRYVLSHPEPEQVPPVERTGRRVAVVGSGPAGLSAAYFLAKGGHSVHVFESAPEPGGMLRFGIPEYRLPCRVVDRDIANVRAVGVTIHTSSPVESVAELRESGFDAVFLALGTRRGRALRIPGEELEGITDCISFLESSRRESPPDLRGKHVAVIGGGNAAIDPARVALRLGAARVTLVYRRTRQEMPAHRWEVQAALDEGVVLDELTLPTRFLGEGGRLVAMDCVTMELAEPDESGRRRPIPVEGSGHKVRVDLAIVAIGLRPSTAPFAEELKLRRDETMVVDSETLETSLSGVYAGGDSVTGPSMIVQAVAQGKRAAFYMDRRLRGLGAQDAPFEQRLDREDSSAVLARQGPGISLRPPVDLPERPVSERLATEPFAEIEQTMDEDAALRSANRCLDCGGCAQCGECVLACPADAICLDMQPEEVLVEVGSVVLSTGFELFDATAKPAYGFGRFPNVIDAMQMDRILAPTRPYNAVMRPSDGKAPANIAFVLCTGSRDLTVGNRLCSQVCCMYSAKQAQLLMGALPLADITIYYIDIRAFGKGYDEFYEQARAMGVYFVKGRVGRIQETEGQDLVLHYEDLVDGGGHKTAEHDLVVLSVGLLPNREVLSLFEPGALETDVLPFVREVDVDLEPGRTSIDGVFVAGAASAARDIPDTIVHSGAAAAQVAAHLAHTGFEP